MCVRARDSRLIFVEEEKKQGKSARMYVRAEREFWMTNVMCMSRRITIATA